MPGRNSLTTVILAFCLFAMWNNSCLAGVASISGTAVDAETGEPVEGAVVVFEWDQAKGVPGMSYTEHYKTVETVTDSNGRFAVPRVLSPLVNEPYFVIYKKGYYCWRKEWDPMTDSRREDFTLQSSLTYGMDRLVPGKYLHRRSIAPCVTGIDTANTPLFSKAISWELKLESAEYDLYKKKLDSLPPEEKKKTNIPSEVMYDYQKRTEARKISVEIKSRLWNEVLRELYMPMEVKENEQ